MIKFPSPVDLRSNDLTKKFQLLISSFKINNTFMFAGRILQRAALFFPHNCALIAQNNSITYQQLYNWSLAISDVLKKRGIKARDRVCLLYEKSIEFFAAYYGIWQVGAIITPLNTFLTERELAHILEDAKPSAVIVSDALVHKINGSVSIPVQIIVGSEINALQFEQSSGIAIEDLAADEMAALLYTSGTTGLPKGVMLSSKNILTNVAQGLCQTDATDKDRVYGALPLFHSFAQNACVWSSFIIGGTVIVISRIERKTLLEGLTHKPTLVVGVPALYGLFCLMRTVSFSLVRYFLSGGDALADKIRMGFELIYRRRICNGYGLTETSPLTAASLQDELLAPNTVGAPAIGIPVSIRDENGMEVPKGNKGMLWVKGDNIMLGYYNEPEMTNKVLKNGWLDTGDMAYLDRKNRLVISGRHKDLIIHKGFNIYPQEIENILLSHKLVMNVAVVGKPDPDSGEIPIAFVSLKEKAKDITKELKALCIQQLASYKIPRNFIILDALPMTPLAKVDKKRLRKEHFDNGLE